MFEIIQPGLFSQIQTAKYGQQDLGISPGGPQDIFAYQSGNILLNNQANAPALEIIQAPELQFTQTAFFVLTGAAIKTFLNDQTIEHGVVHKASKGSTLKFTERSYGFRTYLCFRKAETENFEGRSRGQFNKIANWPCPTGKIRLVEGPEYKYLNNPESFLENNWNVTNEISSMGICIKNTRVKLDFCGPENMVSEAVADGTVQLTPKGPIILLRHRQTTGGYPRIFNVISADVDLLAQLGPGASINFKQVTLDDALEVMKQQRRDLLTLEKSLA